MKTDPEYIWDLSVAALTQEEQRRKFEWYRDMVLRAEGHVKLCAEQMGSGLAKAWLTDLKKGWSRDA